MSVASRYTPPEDGSHVYHYTDANALISIVKKKELWFSDIRYLNDSREGRHLSDLYFRVATSMIAELEGEPDVRPRRYLETVLRQAQPTSIPGQPFVLCFSKKYDSLNQWVTYGKATPYCIAFDRKELEQVFPALLGHRSEFSYWASDVEYEGEIEVRKTLQERLETIRKSADHPSDHSPGAFDTRTDWIPESFRKMKPVGFKHRSFEAECEYRIATLQPELLEEGAIRSGEPGCYLDFVPGPSAIRPIVVVRLGDQLKHMIKAICVGPGPTPSLAAESVRKLLFRSGYAMLVDGKKVNVPVEESGCPYRPMR